MLRCLGFEVAKWVKWRCHPRKVIGRPTLTGRVGKNLFGYGSKRKTLGTRSLDGSIFPFYQSRFFGYPFLTPQLSKYSIFFRFAGILHKVICFVFLIIFFG